MLRFDFDEDRTYFRATLPAHLEYATISALQDAAYLRTVGSNYDAFRRVLDAWRANQASAILATEMIRLHAARDEIHRSEEVFRKFAEIAPNGAVPHLANVLAENLLEYGQAEHANQLLDRFADSASAQDAVDFAILARRLKRQRLAHRFFERAGDPVKMDPRALHEFAQTKMHLAQDAFRQKRRSWREVNSRLLKETRDLLERVIQMEAGAVRHAWAWRDLARSLSWLRAPDSEVVSAFESAMRLLPQETRFRNELESFLKRRREHQPRSTSKNINRKSPVMDLKSDEDRRRVSGT